MRICILTHTFPRSKKDSAAPFMRGLAEGLAQAGNQVTVLTPYSPEFVAENTSRSYRLMTYKYVFPFFLHKLGYSQTLNNDMKLKPIMYILAPLMIISGVISLYRLVRMEKIELVNAHWILPNGFIAAVVSRICGVPVVSTLPGSDVYMVGKNVLYKWMAKIAADCSLAITSNSPNLLNDLARLIPVSRKKFQTIIYGVDAQKFKPSTQARLVLRRTLDIPKRSLVVLGVGRLVAKKGFRYLIKAAEIIVKKYPRVRFVIVGDGSQQSYLKELTQKLKLEPNFRFVGAVNYTKLVDYYNLADIFVLPSIRDEEGNLDDQSVAVVEAMACGIPVITTNFEGYKIVVSPANGILTKEKDYRGIAKALGELLGSEKRRLEFGRASRASVIKKFTWYSVGQQYYRLFKSVANTKTV